MIHHDRGVLLCLLNITIREKTRFVGIEDCREVFILRAIVSNRSGQKGDHHIVTFLQHWF